MAQEKKLTKEEIAEIKTISAKYDELVRKLGEVVYRIKMLNQTKEGLELEINRLNSSEDGILKKITDKYGRGSINTNNWTFSETE